MVFKLNCCFDCNELKINNLYHYTTTFSNLFYPDYQGRYLWETLVIIYPNPLKDHLNISINSDQSCILNLSIYNSNGEIVRHFSFKKENAQKLFSIPVTNLQNGIYFLNISTPEQSQTKKVIINH